MRVPRSTYRLQVTPTWTLIDAARLVPQLHRLGADWVYLSPLLQSETGSEHGYDVTDHGTTDPARGGREGLAALADAAHEADMGVLVDIVPNHVGVATPDTLDLVVGRAARRAAVGARRRVRHRLDRGRQPDPAPGPRRCSRRTGPARDRRR